MGNKVQQKYKGELISKSKTGEHFPGEITVSAECMSPEESVLFFNCAMSDLLEKIV